MLRGVDDGGGVVVIDDDPAAAAISLGRNDRGAELADGGLTDDRVVRLRVEIRGAIPAVINDWLAHGAGLLGVGSGCFHAFIMTDLGPIVKPD